MQSIMGCNLTLHPFFIHILEMFRITNQKTKEKLADVKYYYFLCSTKQLKEKIMIETQTQDQAMPKCIVLEKERKQIDEQLRNDLRAAQESYSALKAEENLGTIPQPHGCTEEWLRAIYEQGKLAVDEAKFLTVEQRNSQKGHWGKLYHRMQPHVAQIQNFIAAIPQEQFVYDEQLGTFYYRDLTGLAKERATYNVPDGAAGHWQKIQAIMGAIKELRQWEANQDVRKIPVTELLNFDKNRFIEAWVKGSIKRDHSMDNKPYMAQILANRRAEEEMYL